MESSSSSSVSRGNETCARLVIGSPSSFVFIKGTWFPSHFSLSISDGLHSWICHATEQAVADRAAGWDETATEYLQRAQFYLSHQRPESSYAFVPDGDNRKLSWTMEKHGTKLEGKWKCEKARCDQQTNSEILNFLMDANIKLSDELLHKTQSFERMKAEAEKCLKQNEVFKNEKQQFETDIFRKFVAVLNTKKAKIRELRDKVSMLEPTSRTGLDRENDLEDETENEEDEGGDDEANAVESDSEEDKPALHSNASHAKHVREDKSLDNTLLATSSKGLQDKYATVQIPSEEVAGSDETKGSNDIKSGFKMPKLFGTDSKISGQPVDSAAALLAEANYTSAPKRRRRL